ISDPDPPIKNLRIDPERKRLAWDQHGNVSEIGCYVNSKILKKAIEKPYCSLGDLSCEVKNYTVKVIKGQPFSAWIQYPKQGNPLAAADNLTCRVHDVDQLSCSWAVGEEAPANVQYHFYLKHPLGEGLGAGLQGLWVGAGLQGGAGLWDGVSGAGLHDGALGAGLRGGALGRGFRGGASGSPPDPAPRACCPARKTWPCPKYMQNQQGVNVQCHFDSLSLQPERQTLFRFLVNGTSGGSKIPCRQMTHRLEEIEILAAPNITKKWCNENYSFMEWEVRSLFTEDIKYELEIQKGTDLAYKEETELKVLGLRNPGPYTVKIKAMDSLFFESRPAGQWSAPQHLDCGRKDASFPIWLVYLLAPLGALLLVGLVFLCRRWPLMQKLFPRVPHVKDPVGDSFQNERMMAWDPEQQSQEECPVVRVQVLGET
ncbi:TPA: interleukin 3 receptor, alpha-like, partial [Bos taurus]